MLAFPACFGVKAGNLSAVRFRLLRQSKMVQIIR